MANFLRYVALIVAILYAESKYIEYNTSQSVVSGKLNVHLVPHSHDDVGWLKTVDQYYVGSNNSIQGACVRNVLDSVIPALLADKNRKFIYVEQAFFQRWWREQSDTVKQIVRDLVSSGQLEFINGGICMHDEATPHYIDMIDQTTLGHRFLKEEFDVIPRIGWQIDPFGHSAVQAYLLGSEVGFDALFFARIDYQDRAKKKNERSLELIWQGSKSLGSSAEIFAGVFPEHYDPPEGFYFEVNDDSPIVQDDLDLFDYNVQDRVNDFVATAISQANVTRKNHVMWTMGTDFKYQYAHNWFLQMDKLIHYVNMDGRVNALYSTPSIYTDAKYASGESWPLKTGDFFPYADHVNAYWTGYFTSRPSFKRYVRIMSGYYLAARQLEFFRGRSKLNLNTDSLAEALAIGQHHDAVSGTEKQHVANDYAKRLWIGYAEAEKLVGSGLACLVESACSTDCQDTIAKFKQCPLLNISYCPASESNLSVGNNLIVLAYNSLAWERSDFIMIPVTDKNIVVYDSKGNVIESQILPLTDTMLEIRNFYVKAYLGKHPDRRATHRLAFMVTLPPLGFGTYKVASSKRRPGVRSAESSTLTLRKGEVSSFEVGQGRLRLGFSAEKGKYTKYTNNKSLVNEHVELSYAYYAGANKSANDPQASGAYIFRPNGTFKIAESEVPLTVVRGPLMDEVHHQINQWIHQITRLYKGKEHVEIEFTVGPIPIDDGVGKEVVTQITTTMTTKRTFYTDSNGRDFIKRIRDYRFDWDLEVNEPVAGNYYPINLGIHMNDHKNEISVLVDRSTGGSSIKDGEIELMLHRRLLHDDSRGVDEALNETVWTSSGCAGLVAQGKFYFRIDPIGEGARWRRTTGQEIYSPILLAFSEEESGDWMSSHVTTFSATNLYNLPDNIAIITLEELPSGSTLLRLAHLYEAGEDKTLSVISTVELKKLFPSRKIVKVREMSLSANQERSEMEKKKLVWKVEGSRESRKVVRGRPLDHNELVVELTPMEIRTFIIEFESKMHRCS